MYYSGFPMRIKRYFRSEHRLTWPKYDRYSDSLTSGKSSRLLRTETQMVRMVLLRVAKPFTLRIEICPNQNSGPYDSTTDQLRICVHVRMVFFSVDLPCNLIHYIFLDINWRKLYGWHILYIFCECENFGGFMVKGTCLVESNNTDIIIIKSGTVGVWVIRHW